MGRWCASKIKEANHSFWYMGFYLLRLKKIMEGVTSKIKRRLFHERLILIEFPLIIHRN